MAHCTSGAFANSMAAAAAATQYNPQQQETYGSSSSSSSMGMDDFRGQGPDGHPPITDMSGTTPNTNNNHPATSSSFSMSTTAATAMHPCRVQGELLYRHHRQQFQMRQERVSDAQLSDAYFMLSGEKCDEMI